MPIKCTTDPWPRKLRSGFAKVLVIALLPLAVAGCRRDAPGPQVAGWSVIDPEQRHPILVSQQPATLNLHIGASSDGLTPAQRARVLEFAGRSRASDAGNSRIVISAPGGSANEGAAMQAADEARRLMIETGYSETSIAVEAYHADGRDAPLRLSYMRYVAEAPECGQDWSENLAANYQNTPYPNMGCAGQRNLAAMVANPADLLGPRTMTSRDANRRDDMYSKYVAGKPLGADAEAVTIAKPVSN
ncbi:CpaD family pilus assembly protein [Hyphomicrobium sp.]|uniref:CpaD family pilus assembly protein n=1 Tax=Hyphomicrobium sp. TaxID=82 RepID=UPI001D26909C|nr:CpaD family pilus assembly protein [Hyphomicrobium sp.]MBY0560908.1 CpaD family pilus assembly protein [Hyphomicrobium sp.]